MVDSGEEDIVITKRKSHRVIVDDEDIEDQEPAQQVQKIEEKPKKVNGVEKKQNQDENQDVEKYAQKEIEKKSVEVASKEPQSEQNGHSDTKNGKHAEKVKISEKLKDQKLNQKPHLKTPEKKRRSPSSSSQSNSSSNSDSSSSGSSSSGSSSSSEDEDDEKARRYKEIMERKKLIEKKKQKLLLKTKKKLESLGLTAEEKAQLIYKKQLEENQKHAKKLEDKREQEKKKREQKELRKNEQNERRNTPKKESKGKSSAMKKSSAQSKPISSFSNLEYVVEEFAKRWSYAMPAWPPKDFDYGPVLQENGFRLVTVERFRSEEDEVGGLKKVQELELYPGVFKDASETLHDLRPEDSKPSFANFRSKGLVRMQRLLFEAYKRQLTALEQETEPYDSMTAVENRKELEKKLKKLEGYFAE